MTRRNFFEIVFFVFGVASIVLGVLLNDSGLAAMGIAYLLWATLYAKGVL